MAPVDSASRKATHKSRKGVPLDFGRPALHLLLELRKNGQLRIRRHFSIARQGHGGAPPGGRATGDRLQSSAAVASLPWSEHAAVRGRRALRVSAGPAQFFCLRPPASQLQSSAAVLVPPASRPRSRRLVDAEEETGLISTVMPEVGRGNHEGSSAVFISR
jgi:hypothetical protein